MVLKSVSKSDRLSLSGQTSSLCYKITDTIILVLSPRVPSSIYRFVQSSVSNPSCFAKNLNQSEPSIIPTSDLRRLLIVQNLSDGMSKDLGIVGAASHKKHGKSSDLVRKGGCSFISPVENV